MCRVTTPANATSCGPPSNMLIPTTSGRRAEGPRGLYAVLAGVEPQMSCIVFGPTSGASPPVPYSRDSPVVVVHGPRGSYGGEDAESLTGNEGYVSESSSTGQAVIYLRLCVSGGQVEQRATRCLFSCFDVLNHNT